MAIEGYIIASEVGLTASLSLNFLLPAWVTQATSGENPLRCSVSLIKNFSGINKGK